MAERKNIKDVNLSVNLETDDEARLQLARAALAKLQRDVDSLVDIHLAADENADRDEIRRQVLDSLPQWCAEDWKVDVRLLVEGVDNKAVEHDR